MRKRKFGIDSDGQLSNLLSLMTGDQVATLQHVQDELPTNLKYLAPLLEGYRQAYEAAAPSPPKIPVKVKKIRTQHVLQLLTLLFDSSSNRI